MKTLLRIKEHPQNFFAIVECHEHLVANEKMGLKQGKMQLEIDFENGIVYQGPVRITESSILEEEQSVICKVENRLIEVEFEWNKEYPSGKAMYKSKK